MLRLTPLWPLKVHVHGGGGRERKERVKSQTKALVLLWPQILQLLCTGAQAALSDHTGFTSTSEIYKEYFSIVFWTLSRGFISERKNYGLFPFSFWANLCLPGYTKPCWISSYQHSVSCHAEGCLPGSFNILTFPKSFFFVKQHFYYTLNMCHILSAAPLMAISFSQRNSRG